MSQAERVKVWVLVETGLAEACGAGRLGGGDCRLFALPEGRPRPEPPDPLGRPPDGRCPEDRRGGALREEEDRGAEDLWPEERPPEDLCPEDCDCFCGELSWLGPAWAL